MACIYFWLRNFGYVCPFICFWLRLASFGYFGFRLDVFYVLWGSIFGYATFLATFCYFWLQNLIFGYVRIRYKKHHFSFGYVWLRAAEYIPMQLHPAPWGKTRKRASEQMFIDFFVIYKGAMSISLDFLELYWILWWGIPLNFHQNNMFLILQKGTPSNW